MPDAITIKTNGHARELKSYAELPAGVAAREFDYVGELTEADDAAYDSRFFEYRGSWYDTQEFQRVPSDASSFEGWDGVQTESYFSAVLIRYPFEWDGMTVDYGAVVVAYAHW